MRNLVLTAAMLLLPAAAHAADMLHLDRDGYKLEYQVAQQPDGTQLITGQDLSSREPFELHVKGRVVQGTVAGRKVSYLVSKRAAAAVATPR